MKYDPSNYKLSVPLEQVEREFSKELKSISGAISPDLVGYYERFIANRPTWGDHLYTLSTLPIIIAGYHKWEPVTLDEKKAYEDYLWFYNRKAAWLYFLCGGDNRFNKALNTQRGQSVKPFAQLSKAWLDLCIDVVDYANFLAATSEPFGENIRACGMIENLESLKNLVPAELWSNQQFQECHAMFLESGLLDGDYVPTNKKRLYEAWGRHTALFEGRRDSSKRSETKILPPGEYIPMLAHEIAKDDIVFRNSPPLQEYIKAQIRIKNIVKKNKSCGPFLLENGEFILPKNAKRPRKGFGHL